MHGSILRTASFAGFTGCRPTHRTHGSYSVLGAPIFYRLWAGLRRTGRRCVTSELVSVAMMQKRSPEPMWTSALPAMSRHGKPDILDVGWGCLASRPLPHPAALCAKPPDFEDVPTSGCVAIRSQTGGLRHDRPTPSYPPLLAQGGLTSGLVFGCAWYNPPISGPPLAEVR